MFTCLNRAKHDNHICTGLPTKLPKIGNGIFDSAGVRFLFVGVWQRVHRTHCCDVSVIGSGQIEPRGVDVPLHVVVVVQVDLRSISPTHLRSWKNTKKLVCFSHVKNGIAYRNSLRKKGWLKLSPGLCRRGRGCNTGSYTGSCTPETKLGDVRCSFRYL